MVYIVSDVRSGSTLLDQLLGQHRDITSVGEIHWLKNYFNKNRPGIKEEEQGLCACGEMVEKCELWSKVEQNIAEKKIDLKEFETYTEVPKNSFFKFAYNILLSLGLISLLDPRYNTQVLRNCEKIFDEIHRITGTKYILESSKETERAKFYDLFLKNDCKFIFLVRDGRGVTWSKMKRGMSFFSAAMSWITFQIRFQLLWLSMDSEKIIIRYEDLCGNYEAEQEKIFDFLEAEPLRVYSPKEKHNIGGSPYRFNKGMEVPLVDTNWKTKLSTIQKRFLYFLFFPFNYIYKYHL